jgi:hypothetical protein
MVVENVLGEDCALAAFGRSSFLANYRHVISQDNLSFEVAKRL